LWIEQVFVRGFGPEPDVIVPVVPMREVHHHALGVLAGVEDL